MLKTPHIDYCQWWIMAAHAVLSFLGYWSLLQSTMGILFWCTGLIIMGLNGCTVKFNMTSCKEKGKKHLVQDKLTFHLWAKLDYLVLLIKKKNLHQMLQVLNTGSLCAGGCRFHSFRALPDGKRSVTLYICTRPQVSDLKN